VRLILGLGAGFQSKDTKAVCFGTLLVAVSRERKLAFERLFPLLGCIRHMTDDAHLFSRKVRMNEKVF
jgi:hypothetical protein